MASIYDWDRTATDNDNADANINWAEGQAPSTVNNSARFMMQRLAEFIDDLGATVDSTGASNAYAVTIPSSVTAYARGLLVAFRANFANTGAATLNVNSIGATDLKDSAGTALTSGAIASGQVVLAVYDSTDTEFRIVNSSTKATQIGAGDHDWYGDLSGTNTYTVGAITGFTPTAYETGMKVRCRVVNESTSTTPTINVNSLGAKTIVKNDGTALGLGELKADSIIELTYDGTNFRLTRINGNLFRVADTGTTNQTYPVTIQHATSGTAAVGFGVGHQSQIESAAGTNRTAHQSLVFWSDATNGSEDSRYLVRVMEGGSLRSAYEVFETGAFRVFGDHIRINTDLDAVDQAVRVYDSTAAADRDLRWNDTNRRWEAEDKNGNFRPIVGHQEWNAGTLAASTLFSQAHGLGAVPKTFYAFAECTIADGTYAVGDRISLDGKQDSSAVGGLTVYADATNIYLAMGTGISVIRADAAGVHAMTLASWDVILAMLN